MKGSSATGPMALRRDPARVRADILRVATSEFVANGFGGTRVDEIAARTHTTKRMIYYYFDSKEALFVSVMDRTFDEYWQEESRVDMTGMDPVSAMRHFAEDRFDAYLQNSDFVRLLAIENRRAAAHFVTRAARRPQGKQNLDIVAAVLEQGTTVGIFRADIDSIDVRMLVVSYATFRTVFQSTVHAVYGRDMLEPSSLAFYRKLAGDMLVATLTTFPDET
jgi:AcrR family transcriptional regulator